MLQFMGLQRVRHGLTAREAGQYAHILGKKGIRSISYLVHALCLIIPPPRQES